MVVGLVCGAVIATSGSARAQAPHWEPRGISEAPAPHDGPAPSAQAPGGKRDANNALYFELGGPGLLYTVNYERAFGDFSARVGASYFQFGMLGSETRCFSAPLTVNFLGIGRNGHIFELGAGMTFYRFNDDTSPERLGTVVAGYRYASEGGFLFRTGVVALYDFKDHWIQPLPHLSFGATF
jgi:hypothetical protein